MISFPSQTPRSPFSRFLRIGVVVSSAMIFVASLVGFAYALWPAKDLGTYGNPDGAVAITVGYQGSNAGSLGKKYGNGEIPVTELREIAPGRSLVPAAAEQFTRLRQALNDAGHQTKVNSAYRTLAEQKGLINRYGLLGSGGTAAPVGESDHGLGLSVDLRLDGDALAWMSEHAESYGFKNTVSGEPWHWTYVG